MLTHENIPKTINFSNSNKRYKSEICGFQSGDDDDVLLDFDETLHSPPSGKQAGCALHPGSQGQGSL
jgi:hypothetical protein